MVNPELGPREPGNEIPQEGKEKEQTPEEIFDIVDRATNGDKKVLITWIETDGTPATRRVLPFQIEGDLLLVETSRGASFINISSIKKAEIIENKE